MCATADMYAEQAELPPRNWTCLRNHSRKQSAICPFSARVWFDPVSFILSSSRRATFLRPSQHASPKGRHRCRVFKKLFLIVSRSSLVSVLGHSTLTD